MSKALRERLFLVFPSFRRRLDVLVAAAGLQSVPAPPVNNIVDSIATSETRFEFILFEYRTPVLTPGWAHSSKLLPEYLNERLRAPADDSSNESPSNRSSQCASSVLDNHQTISVPQSSAVSIGQLLPNQSNVAQSVIQPATHQSVIQATGGVQVRLDNLVPKRRNSAPQSAALKKLCFSLQHVTNHRVCLQLSKNVILLNKVGQGSVIHSTDGLDGSVPIQVSAPLSFSLFVAPVSCSLARLGLVSYKLDNLPASFTPLPFDIHRIQSTHALVVASFAH